MRASEDTAPVAGLQVRCRRHAVAPSVAVRVWLRGGLLTEPLPGLALASGRLLVEGTRSRSWDRIARETEDLGMDLSGFGSPECTGLRLDALRADWRAALDLAVELVLQSTFPEERWRWIREQTSTELESLAEQPAVRAGWAFMRQLYGEHPWGRPLQGDPESLRRLTREDCASFHRRALRDAVIVSIVGDLDEEEAGALASERFGVLAGGSLRPITVTEPPASPSPFEEVELPPGDQVHVLVGHLTVPVGNPDFVALEVASVLLGAGPGLVGRLPERLRERDGLAYSASVATAAGAGSQPGRLVVHVATGRQRADAAVAAIREELERFVTEGITEAELDEARSYLLGSDPFRRETARQLAALQAQAALHGMPFDEESWLSESLAELDVERLEAAMRRHIDPGRLVVTLGVPTTGA